MPWPVTWTIWMYVICVVGTVVVVIYETSKLRKKEE